MVKICVNKSTFGANLIISDGITPPYKLNSVKKQGG